MLAKARELDVDEIVIDLEDAVHVDEKEPAREVVVAALGEGAWRAPTVAVRINATDSPWSEDDVRALAAGAGDALASLIVPKAERAADVERVAELCGGRDLGLELLIETATGLAGVAELARAHESVEALIVGYADLAASLGRPPVAADEAVAERWGHVLDTVLVAARTAGAQAIDGPYFDLSDTEACRRWADQVAARGYDGKWALHPSQVEPINAAFTPTEEELDRARELLDALEADDRGALRHGGEMVDEASRKQAEQLLVRARAAGA